MLRSEESPEGAARAEEWREQTRAFLLNHPAASSTIRSSGKKERWLPLLVPLAGDQLSVPSENRVGRHERGAVLFAKVGRSHRAAHDRANQAAPPVTSAPMVRRDLGADVAASVARLAVMPLERAGGQAQFIEHAPPSEAPGAMTPLLTWIEQNLSRELPLPVIARRAAMSTRTLSRRFREQVGTTPAAWLSHARVRRAQRLLETTDLAIEQVAAEAGFGSAAVMREHFGTVIGTSPLLYRRAFSRVDRSA